MEGLSVNQQPDSSASEMDALLQVLWKQNYGILLERLKLIRNASDQLGTGSLDCQTRQDAEAAAHKLAGILGTFGLPQGSALASTIETSLAPEKSVDGSQLRSWLEELEAIIASRS